MEDFVAGWIGGASSVLVGHPMDTVKTRLQAGTGYRNTVDCILTMFKKEGVTGFFKGMSFPLASIAVYSSVVFGVFSNTQKFLIQYRYGESSESSSLSDLFLASMVSGVISVGLGGPVDLIKIRLQMQTEPFHKVVGAIDKPSKAEFLRIQVHIGGGSVSDGKQSDIGNTSAIMEIFPHHSCCKRRKRTKGKRQKSFNLHSDCIVFLWMCIAFSVMSPLELSWIIVFLRRPKSTIVDHCTLLLLLYTVFSWFYSLH
ncbi:solute carrier family 25 member 48 isoform X2 [Petaurus breviceps papuanus]|uniref:solute carrier family 25 member 48 isoform X2 n=1 Tax=Petaurus breviceps papuanus TaxID=3040969 RepID=UPI0036DBA2F6